MRVELVSPIDHAAAASRILTESWPPPCLTYPPAYLQWQFGFTGPSPALGVIASDDDEPVGFAAAVPRRVRIDERYRDIYVVSFVAVRPPWQGRGIVSEIYRTLLSEIKEREVPVVTFAVSGSIGQKVLERSYANAGLHLRSIGEYRVHAAAIGPETPPDPIDGRAALMATADRVADSRRICLAPTAAQWGHYWADPRRREPIVDRDDGRDGEPLGAAMIVRPEVATSQGVESVTVVENLYLDRPDGGSLRRLLVSAGRRWSTPGASCVITVPNVHGIDPATLRSSGLRQTRSCFHGYVAAATLSDAPLSATATNLEIF